jgi:ferredoxin/flavodoxin---NADP+ reductase
MSSALAAGPTGSRARPAPPAAVENATIVARDDPSPTIARFLVHPDAPMLPFRPGQYVTVGVRVDGRIVQRPYSSAAHPRTADAHELLVRHVPGGALTPHLWRASVGDRVHLGRAKGAFVLDEDDDRAHLLVASGTGIAPFISMIRALADRDRTPSIVVVHGVSRATDLAYRDLLGAWDAAGLVRYLPTVSRPGDPGSEGWPGRTGRTDTALSDAYAALGSAPSVAYLCGNPGMVENAAGVLRALGCTDVRGESFWESGATAAA